MEDFSGTPRRPLAAWPCRSACPRGSRAPSSARSSRRARRRITWRPCCCAISAPGGRARRVRHRGGVGRERRGRRPCRAAGRGRQGLARRPRPLSRRGRRCPQQRPACTRHSHARPRSPGGGRDGAVPRAPVGRARRPPARHLQRHAPRRPGLFLPAGLDDRWLYGVYWDPEVEQAADFDEARMTELIRLGAGVPGLAPQIERIGAFSFRIGTSAASSTPTSASASSTSGCPARRVSSPRSICSGPASRCSRGQGARPGRTPPQTSPTRPSWSSEAST